MIPIPGFIIVNSLLRMLICFPALYGFAIGVLLPSWILRAP